MNKNILKISTLVAIWAFCSQNATAQQGFGTNQPSKASVIEMKSGTKGLLIPRVALTGLNNFDPIKGELGTDAAKVNSLLVYNTATTTGITPGYYYWTTDGTTPNSYWKRLLAGDDAAALSLLGDVTGTLGATTVVKIQGRDVANAAPTSNQVLTWNGSAWTPTSLTPAQITDAQNVTAGSNKVTLGGTPVGASLQPFSIDVVEANLTLSNMGGKVTTNQITPGAGGQVLVTSADGTTTNWVEQFEIVPATTNALTSVVNSMTSNVNGVSSSANIINTNGLSVAGTELTSTVNGVPATVDLAPAVTAATTHTLGMSGNTLTSIVNGVSPTVDVVTSNTLVLTDNELVSTVNGVATTPAVDLSKYLDNTDEQEITDFSVTGGNLSITIENGNTMTVPLSSIDTDNQTITDLSLNGTQLSITLERGNTIAVELAALTNTTNLENGTNTTVSGNGSATTPYEVNVATGNGTTLGVVRQADTAPSVTVTNGVLAVDPANVAITNALTSSGNQMSSTVNSGTAQTASIINTNALSLNTDNHLVSTINGIPSSALDLSAAVQAGETLTSITQDAYTGVITYKRERDADQTANVVNATSDNLISYDAGAFLNATTIQNNQLNTVVAQGTGITVTPSTSGNTTTYTVAANPVDAADLTNKGTLSVSGGLEFTGSSNGTDKLLANAGIGVANGGIDNVKLADNAVTTVKILDKNVTPAKIEGGTEGQVLTTNTAGEATWVTPTDNNTITTVKADAAQSYVSVTSNPVTPGETANREYTVGVNAATAQVGTTAGTAGVVKPGHQFEIETDGHLSVKYAMPQFFYMPSVLIDTAVATPVDLYDAYSTQFGSPDVASSNAETTSIPTFTVKELDFYVTYYDNTVIDNVAISDTGVMTYDIIGAPTNLSFVNVVFKVRTTPKP